MKRLLLSFIVLAAAAGTAHADRGFWYYNQAASWTTYFNIINVHDTNTANVSASFYDQSGTLLGSTSRTLAPNALWNFSTADAGAGGISSAALNTAGRGVVKFSSTGGADIAAYTSQFQPNYNSGFNFIISVTGDDQ